MPLHLHRSNRVEHLADALARDLAAAWPEDPFAPLPIVVGSRGMERWLRHRLATTLGVATRLAFPFPRQALDGAARWLLDADRAPAAPFWEPPPRREPDPWQPDAMAFVVLRALRARREDPDFARVTRYVREGARAAAPGDGEGARAAAPGLGDEPVSARELAFSREVAEVLDRLVHDRLDEALAWAREPATAPVAHRWLATLLGDVGAAAGDSPARLQEQLEAARLPSTRRPLFLFGLSTLGPGDRRRLQHVARGLDVHLYALAPSDRWWADVAARREAALEGENALLASLGAPSADLQVWLEGAGYLDDALASVDPSEAPDAPLLARLQGWVLRAGAMEAGVLGARDGSVGFHATFGAMRQCEVLRDELLAAFAADETLEPRHVLVMTPDIETYAPLLAAVFARRGLAVVEGAPPAGDAGAGRAPRLPELPASIADLGLRTTNRVAEALLQLLDLAGERVTASALMGFVGLEPVRRRLGLDADDVADLHALVAASGLRWGLDAEARAAVGQPALDQNTVRFGLERLALGVLMPDEGPLDVVPTLDPALGPAAPLPVESRDRVARVARLLAVGRLVARAREALAEPLTLAKWRDRLAEALDALTATSDQAGWLRAEVDEALEALAKLGGDLPVERAALARWLDGRFELAQRGDRPITGAVTVCAMEPMRSVPYRLVALIGMDDGAFPRGRRPPTWDPFSEPRRGERDRRAVDRHLLLEALLSARERLIVLWSGFDERTGEAVPAAVPVEELLDVLATLVAGGEGEDAGARCAALVTRHPLQPWSEEAFAAPAEGDGGDAAPAAARSFDAGMAAAAAALQAVARGERDPAPAGLALAPAEELPPEGEALRRLALDDLVAGLLNPQRLLLRERLQVYVGGARTRLLDREPLELGALETWGLRDRALARLEAGDVPEDELLEQLLARLQAEGTLPLARGGERALRAEVEGATATWRHLDEAAGEPEGGRVVSLTLPDGLQLVGEVGRLRVRDDGVRLLERVARKSRVGSREELTAWVHLLAAAAVDPSVEAARIVDAADEGSRDRPPGALLALPDDVRAPGGAVAALADLVAVWRRARVTAVRLFRKTSSAAAGEQAKPTTLRAAFHGGFQSRGDGEDPWVAALFRGYDPASDDDPDDPDGLLALARRVWGPVARAKEAGKAVAGAWKRREAPAGPAEEGAP